MLGHPLHALGVALTLSVSTCGFYTLAGSTFEQSPGQGESKCCPAGSREPQRARIVHRARPAIDAWTMSLEVETTPRS